MKPRFCTWRLQKCKEFLDARGIKGPDPNPWTMTAEQLRTWLRPHFFQDLHHQKKEDLLLVMVKYIDVGTIPGLAAWRAEIAKLFPVTDNKPLPPKPQPADPIGPAGP